MRCRKIVKTAALILAAILGGQTVVAQAAEPFKLFDIKEDMPDGENGYQICRVYDLYPTLDYAKHTCYQIQGTGYLRQENEEDYRAFPVTALGVPEQKTGVSDYRSENAVYYNLFGQMIEPWKEYVAPAGDPFLRDGIQVREILLPCSVGRLEPAVFAGMKELKTIYLPGGLEPLEKFTFYGCENLEEIVFEFLTIRDSTVFTGCKKLRGLEKRTKAIQKPMNIYRKNDMVIDSDKKALIQVTPAAKKITIPASVKEIEPLAFAGCSLKTVKVEKGNKTFAVKGRCLYNKKSGKLILAFGKGSKLTLPARIKKIDKDSMVADYKIKELVIPKKLKRTSGWKQSFIDNNEKVRIYYRGKRLR